MKKFFLAFLGTMAAIWATILFATAGLVTLIIAVSASTATTVETEVKEHSILHLLLDASITERESTPSLSEIIVAKGKIAKPLSLETMVQVINKCADDDNIDGIFIECKGGAGGLAQAEALIKAIKNFKATGKWVYAYSDFYSQYEYYIASSADSLFLNPVGMVDIHGLQSQTLYFKDFLEKIGVGVEILRVGTYKSAVEPFMLSGMSEASREQQQHYLNRIWKNISGSIADNRKVTQDKVNIWADSLSFLSGTEFYIQNHLVDRIIYRHAMDSVLAAKTDRKGEDPRLVSIADYATKIKKTDRSKSHIAVLYAEGEITESAKDGIASDRLTEDIFDLMDDDNVAGLILRVNSPGGSAFASEQIWEALDEFKRVSGKPFYVSMSDVAASGGYYISCGADKIYAEPLTLTGSIGIFGMVPNASKLLNDELGIHVGKVSTGGDGLPDLLTPMTENQKAAFQANVNRGYALFTKRCAEGRHMPLDSLLKIAEGRVWDGQSALEHGLVDALGGLDMAINDMAHELDIDPKNVASYPFSEMKWFDEVLRASGQLETLWMQHKLGDAYPLYERLQKISGMSRLMCRMDFITIK